MKRLFFLVLLALSPIRAGEIEEIIRASPSASQYPEAGALILLDRTTVTVREDGSTSTERWLLVKIFEDRGRQRYGDIKQRYNKEEEEVEILVARTHRPGGGVVEPEETGISDVSAPEVRRASAYTSAMLKVVSFPGLERDAILEYHCRVTQKKPPEDPRFFGEVRFGEEEPILKKEFILILPKGMEVNYKLLRSQLQPVVESSGETVVYRWTLTDIPQVIREPYMPEISQLVPRLLYTSFESWDALRDWLWRRFSNSIKITPELSSLAKELSEGKLRDEVIRNSFLYVTREIRNIHLELGRAGYTPNRASDVLKNRYGDCRDKAVLLITLLKAAGIEAFPVFVNRSGVEVIRDIPSPESFDHLIVAIPDETGYRFLDPFATECDYGYLPEEEQGTAGLLLKEEGCSFEQTPAYPPEENSSSSLLNLTLHGNGDIEGELSSDLCGCYARRLRRALRHRTPKERDQYFEQKINSIRTGAELRSCSLSDLEDLTEPSWVKASFAVNGYASIQGDLIRFSLPQNPFDFAMFSGYTSLARRRHPVRTDPKRMWRYEAIVKLPQGFVVEYLPPSQKWNNTGIEAKIECRTENGKIVYTSEFIINRREIGATQYEPFKAICDEFLKPKLREIILKRG